MGGDGSLSLRDVRTCLLRGLLVSEAGGCFTTALPAWFWEGLSGTGLCGR